jgi:hypothetical protein
VRSPAVVIRSLYAGDTHFVTILVPFASAP